MRRFIVITGPTAAGKTAISVQVAKKLGSEIISADSMQIYRGMDIGTAKARPEEMQGVRHHMIDIVQPDADYSVADFQNDAFSIIDRLNAQDIVPIVTGGTGLYVNSLLYRLDFSGAKSDECFRQKYTQLADDKGLQYLYNMLREKDPECAVSPGDRRRIIRRLEIIESSGVVPYDFRQYREDCDFIIIGLCMPRAQLYDRINKRVTAMVKDGLVEEARMLYNQYGDVNALKAIGYKELVAYFTGSGTLDEAVAQIQQNTRRYAKRQLTWFRREQRIRWFDISVYPCIEDTVNDIMNDIRGKGF